MYTHTTFLEPRSHHIARTNRTELTRPQLNAHHYFYTAAIAQRI